MQIRFTKMQGAGNDFVVLDETRERLGLTPAQYRFLADRHFGVGADQILTVRPSPAEGIDFEYLIHNADGGQVQQCGNGARCFARYVRDKGLTAKDRIRVQTMAGVIAPELTADGRVTVDMGRPVLDPARLPFDTAGLVPVPQGSVKKWPLALDGKAPQATVMIVAVSMGNPHAVQLVDDVDSAPVARTGPLIEGHPRFPQRVNAGYLQVVGRTEVRLRVYERGAGETLACGTGACAAVVAGIGLGLLDARVDVHTRGGLLTIAWAGGLQDPVFMTGPATTVFEGQIDIPETP
ncbi:diaminopimelate epimerase [Alicycliphilus denitrificans]|uniref:Diaminopimelate epimerase n=1 Tax=Alicycliphilus denitrificans TaxID=179636 RepID=A0A858ZXU8_9BURK|nr:diaminopimelate epimerase [Alicycliphilus denitrificans]ADV01448.1 diaminopimelate epimerase [Alicycliphilus denitrificans BC]QKD45513.1 diaminopimelate epimerase [Alicycliphilus denitrificans]GAO25005.1 diaminopimelate epimerase [Alicycliphilus sp. B1]